MTAAPAPQWGVRQRPPSRRPSATRLAEWDGPAFAVTAGFWPATGAPCEVFAAGVRGGSHLAATIDDACVVISIALQLGARPADLARSLGSVPQPHLGPAASAPASPIGAVLAALIALATHGEPAP